MAKVRRIKAGMAAGAFLPILWASTPAMADIVRSPAVARVRRVEVTPKFGLSLGDEFVRNLTPGLSAQYFLTEYLSVGGEFLFGVPLATDIQDQAIDTTENADPNNPVDGDHFSNIGFIAGGKVSYTPIYGKVGLLNRGVLRYDLFASVGLGIVNVKGSDVIDNANTLAPSIGIGHRVYLNDWMAIEVLVTDYIFARTLNADMNHKETDKEVDQNFVASAGLSMFFPR